MKNSLTRRINFVELKKIIKERINDINFIYDSVFNRFFNKVVRFQNKNYKAIPIIIISFNQLFYLKKLVEFLQSRQYSNIVIVDNNSTYEPLLDYFKTIECSVTLHHLDVNLGHLVFWKNKDLFDKYSKGYYVITDADIVPEETCSDNFLVCFKKILDWNRKVTKVGFSLKINDIPETNINRKKIIKWESQFWKNKSNGGGYVADIDTTFALYRPGYFYNEFDFYRACRTENPLTAIHGGWYLDNTRLTVEQKYYFDTCNESSSWRIDNKGALKKDMYDL